MAIQIWYPMSPTVHKILVHGSQINAGSSVPVGCLGENASESRNRFYKRDRLSHSRNHSRINNLVYVFHRAIDSSDLLLSSIYFFDKYNNHNYKKLPSKVLELLAKPNMKIDDENLAIVDIEYDVKIHK